jgi:hypothetical protein
MLIETEYDINIYVGDYGTLSVCAYEREYNLFGNLQTNTAKWLSFDIPLVYKNTTLIAGLLETDAWESQVWLDHDAWEDKGFVVNAIEKALTAKEDTAVKLLMWLESLPQYEPVDRRANFTENIEMWKDAVSIADNSVSPQYVSALINDIIAGAKDAGADPEVADWVSDILLLGDLTRRPITDVTAFRVTRREELRNAYSNN